MANLRNKLRKRRIAKGNPKSFLLANIKKNNKCWEWQGSINPHGYGYLSFDGNYWLAHRFSYTIFNGDIVDKLFVCHKCDNKKCINPDHLFLGTNKDNVIDAVEKGIHSIGYGNIPKNSSLSKGRAGKIIDFILRNPQMKPREIAKIFKVKGQTVRDIKRGRTYDNLIVEVNQIAKTEKRISIKDLLKSY